ncbi:MAG: TlpA disulfide reductase family protein [Gammaproteobacteria bacterium]
MRRHAERGLRALTTLLLAGLLAACGPREAAAPDPLAQAPGEWLLINYWAEWCKPCLEEIPELNAFSREHAGKARVLMVNYDGVAGEELAAQARTLGIETPLLEVDPSARFGFARPQVLPATFVIGPDGKARQTLLGPQTVASLQAAIAGP